MQNPSKYNGVIAEEEAHAIVTYFNAISIISAFQLLKVANPSEVVNLRQF